MLIAAEINGNISKVPILTEVSIQLWKEKDDLIGL